MFPITDPLLATCSAVPQQGHEHASLSPFVKLALAEGCVCTQWRLSQHSAGGHIKMSSVCIFGHTARTA